MAKWPWSARQDPIDVSPLLSPGKPSGLMQTPHVPQSKTKTFGTGALAALIGSAAVAVLVPTVQKWEGREHTAYKDVVGIWTICDGDTKNVKPGMTQTDAECDARLERQLIAHAAPVLKCTPILKDKPYALAASASLAYNIGTTAYCKSTAARRFNAGQISAGCDAFLMWNKAGGKVWKGLDRRRRDERSICLKDA